jgi:hypothetical protein
MNEWMNSHAPLRMQWSVLYFFCCFEYDLIFGLCCALGRLLFIKGTSAWVLCKLLICLKGGADMWNLTCLYLTRSTGEDQSWKVFFFYFILFHFLTPLFGKIEVVEPAKLKSNCPVNAV